MYYDTYNTNPHLEHLTDVFSLKINPEVCTGILASALYCGGLRASGTKGGEVRSSHLVLLSSLWETGGVFKYLWLRFHILRMEVMGGLDRY